jgi:PAS domain S-box-containing protein
MALRILNDSRLQQSEIIEVAGKPVFDWRQLQRWGVSQDELPPDSEIRFRELTFFEQYKWPIIGFLTLCVLQTSLIVALVAERRNRQKARMELRKRLEFETLLSERYKLATASGRVIVLDWDLETSNFFFDPMMKSLLGYEDGDVGNQFDDWLRLVHPDDVNLVWTRIQNHIHHGEPRFEVEHRSIQKQGGVRWFVASGTIIKDDEGRCVRVVGTDTDITERKLAAQEIQYLSMRLIESQDQERRRIARELHDGTVQNLAVISLGLQTLLKTKCPATFKQDVSEWRSLCDQSIQELRTLSYLLHPPMLDECGLIAALRWYLAGFSKRTGIVVDLVAQDIGKLPRELEMDMFRVVQECLSNVHRHSKSPTAQIRVEQAGAQVRVAVQDSGVGMQKIQGPRGSLDPASFGVGLSGMRQRLQYLGGVLEIESDNHGTTIFACIPIYPHSHIDQRYGS